MSDSNLECSDDDEHIRKNDRWTAERLMHASYKDLGSPVEVKNRFLSFLLSSPSSKEALTILYKSSSSTTRDYSLEIDTFDLMKRDTVLGYLLLRYPTTLLPLLEQSIVQAQNQLFQSVDSECNGTIKGDTSVSMTRVHARLIHLPPTCTKASLSHLEAPDVGKIWQVQGTVVRASMVQMYESARTYQCSSTKNGCGRTFCVEADLALCHNGLVTPEHCPLVGERGEPCPGANFRVVGSIHTDYQEIKIQEPASRLGMGHIPRSLLIKLQHDLVDTCQPGDQVVVVGSLLPQWPQTILPDVECPIGMALKAHSVRIIQEKGGSAWNDDDVGEMDRMKKEFDDYWSDPIRKRNPIASRDFICKAVCPQLYGMSMIKLALLVTLIGGVPSSLYHSNDAAVVDAVAVMGKSEDENSKEPDQFRLAEPKSLQTAFRYDFDSPRSMTTSEKRSVKTRRRDQSHMLLVGDPGTAKSQVLRFAAALCPRSVMTTGVGTTSAGLTCAAVREGKGNDFVLEAGALVLADKGVCCIDEFGCIRKEDRTTIHEAMEQQTLSVAKGGIVCKLNCRATIIAVMNPIECLYDNHASLSRNTGLGTPLLSRFDIIFKMVDTSDATRDCNISTYLLNRAISGVGFQSSESSDTKVGEELWTIDKLRAYISIVKDKFNPTLEEGAATLLQLHYEKCRSVESSTLPITVRFLESMIRLSQAHARLMYQDKVQLEDAVAIIRIMECSAYAYGGFEGNVDDTHNILYCDPMTFDFSPTADVEFIVFQFHILERYGLLHCMNKEKKQRAITYLNSEANECTWEHMSRNPGVMTSPWKSSPHQPPHCTVQEDHYGRLHFPTQQGRTYSPQTKDLRVSKKPKTQP